MHIKIKRKELPAAKKIQLPAWKPFVEKRQFRRFPAIIPLTYFVPKGNEGIYVQTYDISVEGICLISDEELYVGMNLEIVLSVADNKEVINRKGRIIWSRVVDNHHRMGLRLEDAKLNPIPIVLKTIVARRKY